MKTFGDLHEWAGYSFWHPLKAILNAKSSRRPPYYIFITFHDGADGPPAKTDNHLLTGVEPVNGTKTIDLSGKRVMRVCMEIREPQSVPRIPLINTALFKVDNAIGEFKDIWFLPPEKYVLADVSDDGAKESELVAKSAIGVPLVYNR